jgi:hypothetical protein
MKRYVVAVFAVLTTAALLEPFSTAHAKGPADRIVISSPLLAEDMVLTDRDTLIQISMANLENFEAGSIEPPTGLTAGYTLDRQFAESPGKFRSFDRVVYYPDPAGDLGYVFYEGIVNGSSEYDGRWFRARPVGDAAMRMIIDHTLPQPILLLTSDSGDLRFLDPHTLDEIAEVRAERGTFTSFQANAAGMTIDYQRNAMPYRFDLSARTICPIPDRPDFQIETLDGRVFAHADGSDRIDLVDPRALPNYQVIDLPYPAAWTFAPDTLESILGIDPQPNGLNLTSVYIMTGHYYIDSAQIDTAVFSPFPDDLRAVWDMSGAIPMLYLTDGQTAFGMVSAYQDSTTEAVLKYGDLGGTAPTLAQPLAAFHRRIYLYFPAEENLDAPRGIFVSDGETGDLFAHWLPDLAITQGTYSRDSLYVIRASDDGSIAELVQLDIETGQMVRTRTLTPGEWTPALVRLNSAAVRALGAAGELSTACPAS